MKKLMLFSLIGFVLVGCDRKNELAKEIQEADQVADVQGKAANATLANDLYSNPNAKIIKTADYRFEVDDVKKSQEAIETSVRKFSAYIASSNLELHGEFMEEHITIRVLSDFFEDLMKEIDAQAAYVNYRKIATDDVGKEFVDLESRLKTKREVEQRYAAILRSNAGTIDELLKAEQKIGELHEEIEATISRMNFLQNQVRYSTINLEFYQTVSPQKVEVATSPSTGKKFMNAFSSGLSGAMELLIALTYLWPLLVISAVAFLIYSRRKKLALFKKSE